MRNRLSLRALAALLVALSLFVAACGSSDDDSTETADSGTSSSDDGASDDGDTDGSGDDAASDSSDETPAEDDSATSDMSDDDDQVDFFGGDADAFCAAYAENESLADEFDLFDPDQVAAFMSMSRDLLAESIGNAPGELQEDLTTILGGIDEMAAVLEENDNDFFAAADQVEALSDDAEVNAASDRVDAWIEANCPEAESDSSSLADDLATPEGLDAILGSEAGRELFIDGMTQDGEITREQAECLVDNLDSEMMSALALDPDSVGAQGAADLLDVLAGCGIDLTAFG